MCVCVCVCVCGWNQWVPVVMCFWGALLGLIKWNYEGDNELINWLMSEVAGGGLGARTVCGPAVAPSLDTQRDKNRKFEIENLNLGIGDAIISDTPLICRHLIVISWSLPNLLIWAAVHWLWAFSRSLLASSCWFYLYFRNISINSCLSFSKSLWRHAIENTSLPHRRGPLAIGMIEWLIMDSIFCSFGVRQRWNSDGCRRSSERRWRMKFATTEPRWRRSRRRRHRTVPSSTTSNPPPPINLLPTPEGKRKKNPFTSSRLLS